MLAGGIPGLGEDEAGAGLPQGATLRPEQPMRLSARCLASAGWPAARAAVAAAKSSSAFLYAIPPPEVAG